MNAFITGTEGFIGSYLAECLLSKGMCVHGTIYDLTQFENISHLKGEIALSKCDVRDYATLKRVIRKSAPDFVFHLAAEPPRCLLGGSKGNDGDKCYRYSEYFRIY